MVYAPSVIFIPYLVLDNLKDTAVFFILLGPYTRLEVVKPKKPCFYELVHIFLLLHKDLQEHAEYRHVAFLIFSPSLLIEKLWAPNKGPFHC